MTGERPDLREGQWVEGRRRGGNEGRWSGWRMCGEKRVGGRIRERGGLLVIVLAAFQVQIRESAEGKRDGTGASTDELGSERIDLVLSILLWLANYMKIRRNEGRRSLTNPTGVSNGAGKGDCPNDFLI